MMLCLLNMPEYRCRRYDDKYEMYMSYTDGNTGESRESSFSNSVSHFFDVNGYLCNDVFDAEVLKLQTSLAADKKTK